MPAPWSCLGRRGLGTLDPSDRRTAENRTHHYGVPLHRLACEHCGETTCYAPPYGISTCCFGPYLQAVLAMLAGAYRLSKRQIQQIAYDLFGLSISTGMVSKLERLSAKALEAPYNELAISVHQAEVVNVDETSWRENRRKVWLWATVTKLATVFTIAAHRSRQVASALLGSRDQQVVGSDRYSVYEYIEPFCARFVGRTCARLSSHDRSRG